MQSDIPTGPRRRKNRRPLFYSIAAVLFLAIIIVGIAAGPLMSRVEQPHYRVLASEGSIEIREYGPMIAAQAVVRGEQKAALREGFRLIAGYIFGANKAKDHIAMTAPVQERAQKIEMTAPVSQQRDGGSWIVRFIMPSKWTLGTLPVPDDPRVTLDPITAERMLVIRFSGSADETLIRTKTDVLQKYAADYGLKTVGEPLIAFYNPPWTLPFLRRNEIMFELGQPPVED